LGWKPRSPAASSQEPCCGLGSPAPALAWTRLHSTGAVELHLLWSRGCDCRVYLRMHGRADKDSKALREGAGQHSELHPFFYKGSSAACILLRPQHLPAAHEATWRTCLSSTLFILPQTAAL